MHVCIVGKKSDIAQACKRHFEQMLGCDVTMVGREDAHPLREVDVLITLAGSVANSKLKNMGNAEWERALSDNLTSVFDALKRCTVKEGGAVVVVGSIVGSTGGFGCANYAAAKAGLVGLMRAAANEWPKVRVNLLELGYVEAGMGARLSPKVRDQVLKTIPMQRFAKVDEVVAAIDFLARGATYMSGGVLTYAGGLR